MMKKQWFMSAAGRPLNPNICFMSDTDDIDWKKKFEEAEAARKAEAAKKESAIDSEKSLRTRAQEAEAERDRLKKEAEEKEEEEARKRGEYKTGWDKEKERSAELQSKLDAKTKEAALDKALIGIKLVPETVRFVRAEFMPKIKVKDDTATIDGQPVSEAVKAWAESDEAKHFIIGGSTGGGSGNSGEGGESDQDKPKPYTEMSKTERLQHRKALIAAGKQAEADGLIASHGY